MTLASEEEAARIAAAIAAAEAKTSGEIVAVIAPASAGYREFAVLWAALAALAVPWPLIYGTYWSIELIYLVQLVAFAVLVLAAQIEPVRLALVPRSVKRQRAHRRAMEQFLAQNLHTTPGRTGVLIFVSVAERFAEIIADAGINAKIPEAEWAAIVDDLTQHIGRGRPGDGFGRAIAAVGEHLARHFPPGSHDPHALANHLIVLPAADRAPLRPSARAAGAPPL
jgi:putative membrane protein